MSKISSKPMEQGCFRAKVRRIEVVGPKVRLELFSEQGQPLQLEISIREFKELGIEVNAEVYVSSKELKVFLEDFMI